MISLQDKYAPESSCFGCGPKNSHGLQIKSIVKGDSLLALFKPKTYHHAFGNILNGGICGSLLDCHSNWCAAYFIMKQRGENFPPCTVTARYSVELLKPTPVDGELEIWAKPEMVCHNKAKINAEIIANGQTTAKCHGLFIAIPPGHPAFHRW